MYLLYSFKKSCFHKYCNTLKAILFISILFAHTSALARDVSFSWIPNSDDPAVDGYRLYYKIGDPGSSLIDYDGVDASGENSSPIEITGQNNSTYILPNLLEDKKYSFVLTSFRGTEESQPTPAIELSATTQTDNLRNASFSWIANTDDPPVDGYRLYYKVGEPGTALTDYNGIDASGQNNSPIEIHGQNTTTYTLQNLLKSEAYSFVLTSFQGTLESQPTEAITLGVAGSPPTANDASIAITEDQQLNGQLTASDPDGDSLVYSIVSNGSKGDAVITNSSTGSFTYIPDPNANGNDSFTFKASDGVMDSAEATIDISIASTNDSPAADGMTVNVTEDTSYTGQLSGNDPDGDTLTFSIVSDGSKGSVTLNDPLSGAFTYTPDSDANGSDSFTFKVNDGSVDSPQTTVDVSIAAVNDEPQAESINISINEDEAYSGQLVASDVDGDSLSYSLVSGSSKGTVIITDSATGAFTYTADADATGSDSFSFKVNDGSLNSSNATVDVTITSANDAPSAVAASFNINEDETYTGQLSGSDPDGDTLSYSIASNGSLGVAVITDPANGSFTYTPDPDENGTDSFTFTVHDGSVSSSEATISVNIAPINDEPTVDNLNISADEDTPYTGQLTAHDPDGDALLYSLVTSPEVGSVTIDDIRTGAFTYTPNASTAGSDSFSFIVNDGITDSATGMVNITIQSSDTKTAIFGEATDADYPGTMEDTFANINTDINSQAGTLNLYSWSSSAPYKIANTILIKTDLSAIPSHATIVDAKLQLYMTSASGAADYKTSVHKVIGKDPIIEQVNGYNAYNGEPWTSVTAGTTYNDIPIGLADIDGPSDTVSVTADNGFVSWQVTNMVRDWINDPATNKGMLLKGQEIDTETGRYFISSENQSTDLRPRLIVRYSTTPPAPELIMIEEVK